MDRVNIKLRLAFWYAFLWIFLIIAIFVSYGIYFQNTTSTISKWIGVSAGAPALLFAALKFMETSYYEHNNTLLKNIALYFLKGESVFNSLFCKTVLFITLILFAFLYKPMGLGFCVSMLVGVLVSLFLIKLSSRIVIHALVRFSCAIKEKIGVLNKLAIDSGITLSMCAVGFGLIFIVILFHIFKDYQTINGFLLGSVIVILPNNIASSIAKRSSKQATQTVKEFVFELEKSDKRNPLLLIKGLSNSVFKVVNLVSILFVCFCTALIAAMTTGANCLELMGQFIPVIIAASGVFSSIIALLAIRTKKIKNVHKMLYKLCFISILILCITSYYVIKSWLVDCLGLVLSISIGAIASFIICFLNFNGLSKKSRPVINITNAASLGLQSVFFQTIKEGFMSVVLPLIIIAFSILFAFLAPDGIESPLLGVYGINLCILGFLSTVVVMLCSSCFGLEAISYKNIFSSFENDYYEKTNDDNFIVSNSGYHLISLTKNFINGAIILTSITSIIAYTMVAQLEEVDILNPYVMTSIILGAACVFFFCALIASASFKCAKRLVFEVKKQLRNYPQILRFELRPDYEKCAFVCAINSYSRVFFYTFLIIAVISLIGCFLKTEAIAGYLAGVLFSSCGLILFISQSSLSAYGAKKYFESEYINIQNSSEYSIISENNKLLETVKDLIVPSLSALIIFLGIFALCLVPLFDGAV